MIMRFFFLIFFIGCSTPEKISENKIECFDTWGFPSDHCGRIIKLWNSTN